jgi:tetratricopeptide (TPR) repeat protein
MATLENLPPNALDTIYWCQRKGDPPSERVVNLLKNVNGHLVTISSFDTLMLLLKDRMRELWKMPDLLKAMRTRTKAREESYAKQQDELGKAVADFLRPFRPISDILPEKETFLPAQHSRDLAEAAVRSLAPQEGIKPWWQWTLEADAESDSSKQDGIYRKALDALPQSAELIFNYANFLWETLKDYDRAEEMYKRVLQIAPGDADNLGNYASFLWEIRKDYDRAEEIYTRALELDPNNANNLANYAQLLLARGRQAEGMEMLHRSELLGGRDGTRLEVAFYRLAHDETGWQKELGNLRALLEQGARSVDWPLEPNIQRAEENGHPNPSLLRALAKVVADEAPLSSLDSFPKWQNASKHP